MVPAEGWGDAFCYSEHDGGDFGTSGLVEPPSGLGQYKAFQP